MNNATRFSDQDLGKLVRKKEGASIIFVNSKRQVLLLLRDKKKDIPFPNHWDVLGGNVEENETPKECIRREMKEEIEVDLSNPELFNVYDMDDRIEYTFWQRIDLDISQIRLHEGQRLKWFSEDEIKKMRKKEVAFGFKTILLDFFSAKIKVEVRP
jgi:8-oxo-dGTP diphosphatase